MSPFVFDHSQSLKVLWIYARLLLAAVMNFNTVTDIAMNQHIDFSVDIGHSIAVPR